MTVRSNTFFAARKNVTLSTGICNVAFQSTAHGRRPRWPSGVGARLLRSSPNWLPVKTDRMQPPGAGSEQMLGRVGEAVACNAGGCDETGTGSAAQEHVHVNLRPRPAREDAQPIPPLDASVGDAKVDLVDSRHPLALQGNHRWRRVRSDHRNTRQPPLSTPAENSPFGRSKNPHLRRLLAAARSRFPVCPLSLI